MAKLADGTSTILLYDYDNYLGFLDPKADRNPLMMPRDSQNGTWGFRGATLFLEIYNMATSKPPLSPIYTMMDREIHDLPSAHQIFVHSADEYEAAMKLVGSWRHWKKLIGEKGNKSFIDGYAYGTVKWEGLNSWREELEIRKHSKAKRALMNLISQNDRGAATRILDDLKPKTRGRPSKADITREAKIEAGVQKEIEADMKRLQYSPAH